MFRDGNGHEIFMCPWIVNLIGMDMGLGLYPQGGCGHDSKALFGQASASASHAA